MMRRLRRTSLALLVLTIAYWLVAGWVGGNFSALDGAVQHPTASGVVGKTEFAWLVDRRAFVISVVSDSSGTSLPLIGRYGLMGAVFNGPLKWNAEPAARQLFVFAMSTLDCAAADGSPVVVRVVWVPYYPLAALLGVPSAISLIAMAWRRSRRMVRARRVSRVRRMRARLGRCACGYDLRRSKGRCPECGRIIRWVPVAIPSVRCSHRVVG